MSDTDLNVSFSASGDWLDCEQKYWYKHVERITPKVREAPPQLGTMLHGYFEAFYKPSRKPLTVQLRERRARKRLAQYEDEVQSLAWTASELGYDDIAANLLALPATAKALATAYHRIHGQDDLKRHKLIMAEQRFSLPVRPGIALPGVIDLVTKTRDGYWLWEHKTTGSVPRSDRRFRDLQTLVYAVALEEVFEIKPAGVIWNYVRTVQPRIPEITQKGVLSKKRVTTTRELYLEAVLQNGEEPSAHQAQLRRIEAQEKNDMFPRYTMPILQQENILLRDYARTAQRIYTARSKERYRPVRHISAQCDWCPYVKLCQAAIIGGDVDDIRRTYYDKDHRQEEKRGKRDEDAEHEVEDLLGAID